MAKPTFFLEKPKSLECRGVPRGTTAPEAQETPGAQVAQNPGAQVAQNPCRVDVDAAGVVVFVAAHETTSRMLPL